MIYFSYFNSAELFIYDGLILTKGLCGSIICKIFYIECRYLLQKKLNCAHPYLFFVPGYLQIYGPI
jgi:hypothetical protein